MSSRPASGKTFRRPRRVRGTVFGPKFGEPLAVVGSGLLFSVVALGFLWGMTGADSLSQATRQSGAVGARMLAYAILGAILMVGGSLVLLYLLIRCRRLVIGKDRLQLINLFGRVIGQVPYANIADLDQATVVNVAQPKVFIRLRKRKRRDTFWPRMRSRHDAYDIVIPSNLESDATAVYLMVRDTMLKNRNQVE